MKSKYIVVSCACALLAAVALAVLHFYIPAAIAAGLAFILLVSLPFQHRRRAESDEGQFAAQQHGVSLPGSRIASTTVVVLVVLVTTLPMGLCPIWNGEVPDHRNQYELLADSLLEGHLYLDLEVDPQLSDMENPYDADERIARGVDYHHDHAFYEGRYYMYFGVVPVVLVFVPFKAVTGMSLTTYHATQLFVAVLEVGLFALMSLLRRRFFTQMRQPDFLLLYVAIALLSVWHFTAAPALYCTAISSGVCMEVLSLLFFGKAAWDAEPGAKRTIFAVAGSLFGALAFGCRPPVALANLLAIPLLVECFRGNRPSPRLFGELALVVAPYIVIGCLLGAYNYARFGSAFEFGQSYQLTVADQHSYGNVLERVWQSNYFVQLAAFLFRLEPGLAFPGVFWQYPFLLAAFLAFGKRARSYLSSARLFSLVVCTFVVLAAIVLLQCIASPWLTIRYQFDVAWLVGLMAFIAIGAVGQSWTGASLERATYVVRVLATLAIYASVVLFLVPCDSNLTDYYWDNIKAFLLKTPQ